jgi:type IV secretion system VirB5/TraC/TraE/TrbJ family protein
MRRTILLAAAAALAISAPANAQIPVIDAASISQLLVQINWLKEQYAQLTNVWNSVAHGVDVTGMAPGLSGQFGQNPLGNVAGLPAAIAGTGGVGQAGGLAQQFLQQGQVYAPQGNDFQAQWMNQRSASLANTQALAYQYAQASQTRLDNLNQLEQDAQGATDVQAMAGIQARIAIEQQYITTQQTQADQVATLAAMQEKVAEMQQAENYRKGNDAIIQQTQAAADSVGVGNLFNGGGNTGGGQVAQNVPVPVNFPPTNVPVFAGG